MSAIRRQVIKLTLEGARLALEASVAKARQIGVDMDIAVVDDAGILLAFYRMDGAKLTSVDVSISKAFTAAGTRKGTHEYAKIANAGGPAFGIHVSNGGRFMVFGGGLPIIVEGQCVGAVGCSSGSSEQDQEVAQAGVDAVLAAAARD